MGRGFAVDAHVQECTEVCGVIFYLRRGVLVQGAAAGVGMRKPLSGDSGFLFFKLECYY